MDWSARRLGAQVTEAQVLPSIGSPGGASKVGPVDLYHPVVMAVPLGKNTEGH